MVGLSVVGISSGLCGYVGNNNPFIQLNLLFCNDCSIRSHESEMSIRFTKIDYYCILNV